MSFRRTFLDRMSEGDTIRQAISYGLKEKARKSFRDSIKSNRSSGKSPKILIKDWYDSTGAFLVGETERLEKKAHKPLIEYSCGCAKCRNHKNA